jgi:hypothetical protein
LTAKAAVKTAALFSYPIQSHPSSQPGSETGGFDGFFIVSHFQFNVSNYIFLYMEGYARQLDL